MILRKACAGGKGLSGKAFSLIKEFCGENGVAAIRVDTQAENAVMQHVLEREDGFFFRASGLEDSFADMSIKADCGQYLRRNQNGL